MGSPPDTAVLMTLAFEDVREFQLQWEGVISHGSCFVPWPRPLVSDSAVKLHVIVVGAGTADVDATVDFNDVDSFGRNGSLLKLPAASVDALGALFQRAVAPPRPSAPTPLILEKVASTLTLSEPAPGSTNFPLKPAPLALSELALELPPAPKLALEIVTGEELPDDALGLPEPVQSPATLPAEEPKPPSETRVVPVPPPMPAEGAPLDLRPAPPPADPSVDAPVAQAPPEPPPPQTPPPSTLDDLGATAVRQRHVGAPPPPAPAPSGTQQMPAHEASKNVSTSERLEPGTLLDNRFQIESHIASGGMGDVYRAAHVFLKRPIALKLLKRSLAQDPEMWARFQREAELVSQLESQHIVRVFDFGRTSAGMPFLAMEFVQGTTLDLLAKEGAISVERAVDLICQVCDGLNEAHGLGIIHRDLKPQNIIVGKRRDGTEVAKILDFGIARVADTQKSGGALTQMGMVVGTPTYLAPEQALADSLDVRTDIYALGCVTFELLTGRPPFVADSLQKLISMHLKDAPPSPQSLRKELSAPVCEVVLKALAKDRAGRWQSARELSHGLRQALEKSAAIPGAFDDWPPKELPRAAAADVWPPTDSGTDGEPPVVQGHEEQVWPPPEPPQTAPAPVSPEVNSFFAFDTGKIPAVSAAPGPQAPAAPTHRLEQAIQSLKLPVPAALAAQLCARRSALDAGNRKLVLLHVEVLRASQEQGARARALASLLASTFEYDAVLDAVDEDGATFLFLGEDPLIPAARALYAGLCAKESVSDEVTGATVRGAAAFGSTGVKEDGPVEGELLLRARTLAAKAPAGKLVAERGLATDIQDVVTVENPGREAVEVTSRRVVVHHVTKLWGRDPVLATLDRRLTSLSQGVVAPVLVTGESGSGRTTIAQELAVRGRHQQVVVGTARGVASLKGQPYSALAELLCSITGVSREQRVTRLSTALEALKLPPPELEAARVVGGLRHVPQPFTPGQAVYALRAVLNIGAANRRVLLVFDGLEEMDPYSVDAFRELCAHPAPRELAVGLCERTFATERFDKIPTLELKGLTVAESQQAIAAWLGDARVSEQLAETIHRRARGLPGLMLDWVHLLADRGQLRFRAGAYVLSGEPPALSDAELAQERVKALWPDARRLFEAVCAAGDTIDGAVLNAVLPQLPQAAYQRLVASRLVRALGGRRWAVASERYARAGALQPTRHRAELHSKLAAVMVEVARASSVQPEPAVIARHLNLAGEASRALPLWRGVIDTALKRRAPREALMGFRGLADALHLLLQGSNASPEIFRARVEALARASDNAVACGEPLLARSLVDEATALANAQKLESAELALSQARVLRCEARRSRATEAIDFALKKAQGTGAKSLAHAERGEALEADGDLKGASEAFRQALAHADAAQELARWHGEVDFRARVETRLAGVLLALKDVGAAKELYQGALTAWRRAAYPYAEARVLANLGALHVHAKETEDAARCFKEAAGAAARAGDLYFQTRQMLNLAKVARRFSANQVARQAADVAKRLATLIGWEEGKSQAASVV